MKFKQLSGNQPEKVGQALLQFWLGSYSQNVAVEPFRKPIFHVFCIINVCSDLDAYPEKLQSNSISFISREV